jgi:hypothetical protein
MESTAMVDGDVIGKNKVRKTLTLPRQLVARVRVFRFKGQFEQESDAYVWLIEQALEQAEREQQGPEGKR